MSDLVAGDFVGAEGGDQSPPCASEDAAQYLANLCGIDIRHFSYPGRLKDVVSFGRAALLAKCRLLDTFPIGSADAVKGPQFKGIRRQAAAVYRPRDWVPRLVAMNEDFLKHRRQRTHYSPLSDEEAEILGSVVIGPRQATFCLDQDRLIVLLEVGREPIGMFYPAENLFLTLSRHPLGPRSSLNEFLQHFLAHPQPFADWVRRARGRGLTRVFVIGDNRPGHFIKQSLAYLDIQEASLIAFAERGGLLAVVPDWCAIDPFAVIPALRKLDRLEIRSSRLTQTFVLGGYDAHRVYRLNTHREGSWLRRRLGVGPARPARDGRFKVMLSIDAERERIINQADAFAFVLKTLSDACEADGSSLEVVWDGWTVPEQPNERDLAVQARIEGMIGAILEKLDIRIARQARIFDRSALAKIPELEDCDLVLVTQGTGAVIPCWLLRRPTITYHAAAMINDRSCLEDDVAFNVDQRAVLESPGASAGHQFELALWGLEDALRRAVGSRLVIRPQQHPPAHPIAGDAAPDA